MKRHLPQCGFFLAFVIWGVLLIYNFLSPTADFFRASVSNLLQIFIVLAVSFGLTQFKSKEKQRIDLMTSFIDKLNAAFEGFEKECLELQQEKNPSVRRTSHRKASMYGRQVQNYFDLLKEMLQENENRRSVQEAENDWVKVYELFGDVPIEQIDEKQSVENDFGDKLMLAKSNLKTKFDWLVAHLYFSDICIQNKTSDIEGSLPAQHNH